MKGTPKKTWIICILMSLSVTIFLSMPLQKALSEEDAIHIAFVGPLSGENALSGRLMRQAVEMYLERINAAGGVRGKRVILDVFDDRNEKELARQRALEIVDQHQAVAVIGHNWSSLSLAGGDVYKEHGLPAISATSTNVMVTADNEWYFRTIFNDDLQGRFHANYAKSVLHQTAVSIIHEDAAYGYNLAQTFENTARKLELDVKNVWGFEMGSDQLPQRLEQIVTELKASPDAGVIFLSTHNVEGATLVRLIRDQGIQNLIMTPDDFATQGFLNWFQDLPQERRNPGYYTNGIYVTSPLIFDTANELAQQFRVDYYAKYEEFPDWQAAFAYDAALVIIEAINQTGVQGGPESLKEDHRKIRDFLAELTAIEQAIEGVTGFNYFDEYGNAQKPISIGMYKQNKIISALTQLSVIRNLNEVSDLEGALADERVLLIDGKYMYKTNVIYTGMQLNEISDLNMNNLTFLLDGYVWFRYQGGFDVGKIEFLNAAEPVELGTPLEEKMYQGITYKRYHLIGRFKADYVERQRPLEKHDLEVSFCHRTLSDANLIYVTDVLGMELDTELAVVETLRNERVLSPTSGWSLQQLWFFRDVIKMDSLGDPLYLNVKGGTPFSRFNMGVRIGKERLTLRRLIPYSLAPYLGGIGGIVLFALGFWRKIRHIARMPRLMWLAQISLTCIVLLSAEVFMVTWVSNAVTTYYVERLIRIFDLLWWIVPAFFVNIWTERFIWTPLEQRTEQRIPNVLRRFVAFIVYLLAFFGIVAFVYRQTLTGLVATSSVFAMIIGLAVKMNLSNIFSGIAINLEHPFRIGDWVRIGSDEGKIVDITWRTTRLQTRYGNVISVSNSEAAESLIHNYSVPDDQYWDGFTVHIAPEHLPERVEKILMDAVLSVKDVLEPWVLFAGVSDWAADYWVYYSVKDYGKKSRYKSTVWKRVWSHLDGAGIQPVVNPYDIQRTDTSAREVLTPLRVLQKFEIFQPFSKNVKRELSKRIHSERVAPEATIMREGESGDSLFIVVEGVVGIWITLEDGKSIEVARRASGDIIGEMALLTGEPRTATIKSITETLLYEITKADIAPFLEAQPELAESLSEILAERKVETAAAKESHRSKAEVKKALYTQILHKIQDFFGLGKS